MTTQSKPRRRPSIHMIDTEADALAFWVAPFVVVLAAFTVFVVVPFGPTHAITDMNIGILFMLGVSSLSVLGIVAGFALGGAISLILVHVVNPQSFHWTMTMHMPWKLLFSVATVLFASSSATALLAGRYAVSGDAVRAVREDW